MILGDNVPCRSTWGEPPALLQLHVDGVHRTVCRWIEEQVRN
jgi:hypothetical protein